MYNLLILYNPYYQHDVVEQHLEMLKKHGVTAFGKVRSVLKNFEHPHRKTLEKIYASATQENPIQLFLTDYDNMYVARIIKVSSEKEAPVPVPQYYNKYEVEQWFVMDDLRLLVQKNFPKVRDYFLANFIAVNYNNHTYAVYGNNYAYPMQVVMKEERYYFENKNKDFRYFDNIFKTEEELEIKRHLINYVFTESVFYAFTSDTQDHLISAEAELARHGHNPLYDFSSIIVKYVKATEKELFAFMRKFFKALYGVDKSLENIQYEVQGLHYGYTELFVRKAPMGTYRYLLKKENIKNAAQKVLPYEVRLFVFVRLPQVLQAVQAVRNEAVHGKTMRREDAIRIRNTVLGIGEASFLSDLVRLAKKIDTTVA
jgi:hypothetical protein